MKSLNLVTIMCVCVKAAVKPSPSLSVPRACTRSTNGFQLPVVLSPLMVVEGYLVVR